MSHSHTTLAVTWDDSKKRLSVAAAAVLSLFLLSAGMVSSVPTSGYASDQLVSVIIRQAAGSGNLVEQAVTASGGHVGTHLGILNGFAAEVPLGALPVLARLPMVIGLAPDSHLHFSSSTYDPLTDSHSMYNVGQTVGYTTSQGTGVDVALIDTGVSRVQGLAGAKIIDGPDFSFDSQSPNLRHLDSFGHGTHMAGIIAGHDTSGNLPFAGVAPQARIVSVKVGASNGAVDISQVIAGISWVVQHAHDPGLNIRVINLSLGYPSTQRYTVDPLAFATEVAWQAGIVVVAAAGNNGTSGGRLNSPASDPFILAVGADENALTGNVADDTVPSFSARGDGTRNPDLIAPGAHLQSLSVPGSYIDRTYGSSGTIDSRFFRGSGTSQAAAVVSGAAAALISLNQSMKPDSVKAMLVAGAQQLNNVDARAQGAGRLNLNAASVYWAAPLAAPQNFPHSTGTGSLEAARGGVHVNLKGVTLSGEKDIFGQKVSGGRLSGSTWSGGSWSGSTWSGSTWSGSTWSGSTWSGSTWSGSGWSNASWNGSTWSGSTWSGSTWSGGTWSGSTWTTAAWS